MQLTILVIDDEKHCRSYACSLIAEMEPRALVVEAGSAPVALRYLKELSPDIVLLDIQMPGMNGFSFLEAAGAHNFELVFITAYSQYAIQAIKHGAFDYLLKPLKRSEFREMLAKATSKCSVKKKTQSLPEVASIDAALLGYVSINQQQGIKFPMLKDIIYIKADNTYTTLFMSGEKKLTTTRPIHLFEKSLSPKWFFRIHKSYIINLFHFKEYSSRDGNVAVMSNGDKLQISRYKFKAFLDFIEKAPLR